MSFCSLFLNLLLLKFSSSKRKKNGNFIFPVILAKNLGVILTFLFLLKPYIQFISKFYWLHLQNIFRIWSLFISLTADALLWATIIAQLHYCSSLLTGLHASIFTPHFISTQPYPEQHFKNVNHIMPFLLLKTFQSFSILFRIRAKVLTIAYKTLYDTRPPVNALIYLPAFSLSHLYGVIAVPWRCHAHCHLQDFSLFIPSAQMSTFIAFSPFSCLFSNVTFSMKAYLITCSAWPIGCWTIKFANSS